MTSSLEFLGDIDPKLDRSAANQIADRLRRLITSGHLPPGSRLPTQWELQGHYGVSRDTVVRALETLKAERLIETRRRDGTFVNARLNDRSKAHCPRCGTEVIVEERQT